MVLVLNFMEAYVPLAVIRGIDYTAIGTDGVSPLLHHVMVCGAVNNLYVLVCYHLMNTPTPRFKVALLKHVIYYSKRALVC